MTSYCSDTFFVLQLSKAGLEVSEDTDLERFPAAARESLLQGLVSRALLDILHSKSADVSLKVQLERTQAGFVCIRSMKEELERPTEFVWMDAAASVGQIVFARQLLLCSVTISVVIDCSQVSTS